MNRHQNVERKIQILLMFSITSQKEIRNVKSRDSFDIAGNFNAKIGTNMPESKQKTD